MKKNTAFLALFIGIVAFMVLKVRNFGHNEPGPDKGDIPTFIASASESKKIDGVPKKIVTGAAQIDDSLREKEMSISGEVFHDPARARDPEYMKMLNRHFELKSYLHSTAKDTVEFAQIEALLKDFGYDEQFVRIAYDAAYEYQRETSRPERELRVLANGKKAREFEKIRGRVKSSMDDFKLRIAKQKLQFNGITNSALVDMILEIKPTAFFGQRELFANKGEKLILEINR